MRGFSKAIITGNLTRDPELRSTPNGASVCSFSVAVNRVYRDASGEQKEDVSFIDCSAWGKLAEMINQYAKKGTGVLVSGRLDQRSWEDKNTGQKRSHVEIVVEDFNFTSNGPRENGGSSGSFGSSSAAGGSTAGADVSMDEIPDDIPDGEIDLSDVPF
ncbi:MAG: single-stranded DNA-binding protein [Candidatus Saccharimonadaceae bacterium]|nr:single-stranded DNA-binding protein [Candidatus Saccharimonadaceae bacterium]